MDLRPNRARTSESVGPCMKTCSVTELRFLGWHVAACSVARLRRPRPAARRQPVAELDVECVTRSARRPLARNAPGGCGWSSTSPPTTAVGQASRSSTVERGWHRNLLSAAKSAGVQRVVYKVPGLHGNSHGGIGMRTPPSRSQTWLETISVRSSWRTGGVGVRARRFPVVIVNPTAPVGDHDVKPTPTGRIVAIF